MKWVSQPRNDFAEFIETYFRRCRERVPLIEASAGKWTFEDLIPGLSDFDTRFFVKDQMTVSDWCHMSTEVGKVHLELARERKEWARNLEHLPGVNLKWSEFLDSSAYFTEFSQWSFYHGQADRLEQARQFVDNHHWTQNDANYHWKKISNFYGPYNRTIDPPVNLGPYENKYSLHSRTMHYMAPPIHSAVCLMERRTFPGKLDAFRKAQHYFPRPETMSKLLDLIGCHYENEYFLQEPGVTDLDHELEEYLSLAVSLILERDHPFECPQNPSVEQLRTAVRTLPEASPMVQLFENIKFARLMKGRLWFYAQDVLWFESQFLVRNELKRIGDNFLKTPLKIYLQEIYGKTMDVESALECLKGDVFSEEDVKACREFYHLSAEPCSDRELKSRAMKIADIFDSFLHAIEKMIKKADRK